MKLSIALLMGASMLAACGGEEMAEVSPVVEEAMQLLSMGNGASGGMPHREGRGPLGHIQAAFRCDPDPEITTMEVCGRTVPSTIHLEWSDCEGSAKSGLVDVVNTVSPEAGSCGSGAITVQRRVTASIGRLLPNGNTIDLQLTASMEVTIDSSAGFESGR
jgi:hypothetical protein